MYLYSDTRLWTSHCKLKSWLFCHFKIEDSPISRHENCSFCDYIAALISAAPRVVVLITGFVFSDSDSRQRHIQQLNWPLEAPVCHFNPSLFCQ